VKKKKLKKDHFWTPFPENYHTSAEKYRYISKIGRMQALHIGTHRPPPS